MSKIPRGRLLFCDDLSAAQNGKMQFGKLTFPRCSKFHCLSSEKFLAVMWTRQVKRISTFHLSLLWGRERFYCDFAVCAESCAAAAVIVCRQSEAHSSQHSKSHCEDLEEQIKKYYIWWKLCDNKHQISPSYTKSQARCNFLGLIARCAAQLVAHIDAHGFCVVNSPRLGFDAVVVCLSLHLCEMRKQASARSDTFFMSRKHVRLSRHIWDAWSCTRQHSCRCCDVFWRSKHSLVVHCLTSFLFYLFYLICCCCSARLSCCLRSQPEDLILPPQLNVASHR